MRAGRLDNTITIERAAYVDDGMGNQVPTLQTLATLRAQIIDESTEEFLRSYGASSERLRIFRTRHMDGLTLADTVRHDGRAYNLKEIKPIGRRRGLELRCVAVGP